MAFNDRRTGGVWSRSGDGAAPVLAVQALTTGGPDLTPLSDGVRQLVKLASTGHWSSHEAGLVLGYDADLGQRLVQLANAYLDWSGASVSNAYTALGRLGTGPVIGLCVLDQVRESLRHAGTRLGLAEGELLRHSAASLLAAIFVAEHLEAPVPWEAPTSALLHDVGILVFDASLPDERAAVVRSDRRTGWSGSRVAELDHLGTTHAHVGGALLGHWELPTAIVDGVACHHSPDELTSPTNRRTAFVTNLCDMIAATVGAGLVDRERDPMDEASALEELGISPEAYARLAGDVHHALEGFLRGVD